MGNLDESAEEKAQRLERAIREALDASDWLPDSIRIWDSAEAYNILTAALNYRPAAQDHTEGSAT